jgi:phosphonate transport system ATP-binding protein
MELIRNVCRERGIACLVNLHQVGAAVMYTDRVIGMNGGEAVYDGPTAKLSERTIERVYGKPMNQLMLMDFR